MRKNWKWKVIILHPNSMRRLSPIEFFIDKRKMLRYRNAWKDWMVQVYKKENNGWEWNEEFSID